MTYSDRTIITNVPTVDEPLDDMTTIVLKLNPNLYVPKCSTTPTPEEAEEHIVAMDNALNLLKKCLLLDPTKRITAANALEHPFFDQAILDQEIRDEEEGMTWGRIENEDDSWQRTARSMYPTEKPETCRGLHEVTVDQGWFQSPTTLTIDIMDLRGDLMAPAFGQGVIDPLTGCW